MSSNGNKLGNNSVIVIIGLIAACITICVFVTGYQSLTQIFVKLHQGFGNLPLSKSFTPIPSAEPTPAEIVSGNWTQVGLPQDIISDIEIVNENSMYVSTWGFQHGIFRTDDGGKSWHAINNGLGNLDIYEITLMNGNGNILIAATDQGLWATRNGGQAWQSISLAKSTNDVSLPDSLFSVSTTSSSIYVVGEYYGGGYVSRDFGGTWQLLRDIEYNANHDNILLNVALQHTTTSQNPSPTIYLAGDENLFRSTNDGSSWMAIAHVGSNYTVSDIVADFFKRINCVCVYWKTWFRLPIHHI